MGGVMDTSRLWDALALWVALYRWEHNADLLSNIEDKVKVYAEALREVGA